MTSVVRTYGIATWGTFSPVVQGGTTEGSGAIYTQNVGVFVSRDGIASLQFRTTYSNLIGGVGNLWVRLPGVPLPSFETPVTFWFQGVALGLGAGETLQATIVNIDSMAIIRFFVVDLAGGGAAVAVDVPTSADIGGSVVYHSS